MTKKEAGGDKRQKPCKGLKRVPRDSYEEREEA
jgi:hypothetical protein